jgi:hypothetical protein
MESLEQRGMLGKRGGFRSSVSRRAVEAPENQHLQVLHAAADGGGADWAELVRSFWVLQKLQ